MSLFNKFTMHERQTRGTLYSVKIKKIKETLHIRVKIKGKLRQLVISRVWQSRHFDKVVRENIIRRPGFSVSQKIIGVVQTNL